MTSSESWRLRTAALALASAAVWLNACTKADDKRAGVEAADVKRSAATPQPSVRNEANGTNEIAGSSRPSDLDATYDVPKVSGSTPDASARSPRTPSASSSESRVNQEDQVHLVSPVSGGEEQASLSDDDRAAMRIITRTQSVSDFLNLAINCNGTSVSVADFIPMRVVQARSMGILQHYAIASREVRGKNLIKLDEYTSYRSGEPIPGIPSLVSYYYVMDWPQAKLIDATARLGDGDPLTFMENHWEAVCNGYFETHHLWDKKQ